MEVAVQKDHVRNQLSANLQQHPVGRCWRNARQRCWAPGAVRPVPWARNCCCPRSSLCGFHCSHCSTLRYALHIRPTRDLCWGGGFLFLKRFTKLCVLAEKFKELENQTTILFPSHCLGTAIATLKGRTHGKKSFFSALLFEVPGLCCKHSLNPGFLHYQLLSCCCCQGLWKAARRLRHFGWGLVDAALVSGSSLLCPPKTSPSCVNVFPPAYPKVKSRRLV